MLSGLPKDLNQLSSEYAHVGRYYRAHAIVDKFEGGFQGVDLSLLAIWGGWAVVATCSVLRIRIIILIAFVNTESN